MNMKKLLILLIISFIGIYYIFDQNYLNSNSFDQIQVQTVNDKPDNKLIIQKTDNILGNHLTHISQMISPASNQDLKSTWQYEYTCSQGEKCKNSYFNARSYEDALWLKRKGYPTKSMVKLLQDLSKDDLYKLKENGNVNAANLLALDAITNKKTKYAKINARYSINNSGPRETFGHYLLANAHLLENNPMLATYNLRVASLLGDTNATTLYEQITVNSASSLFDNTSHRAFSYLLERLNTTDLNNLNNDPRPIGGD